MFLALWWSGFRKDRVESSLQDQQRMAIKHDVSYFLRVKGYPDLIYQNPKLVSALKNPERVTVYRVKDTGKQRIAHFGLESAVEASETDSQDFSQLLCSPTSMTGPSTCAFELGFAIQFHHHGNSFYALVCFSCHDIIFLDSSGEQVANWGMTIEFATALIHKFYNLYPNDAEVQNIAF